jgi:transcriptional regulator with XRE-family HTH domain
MTTKQVSIETFGAFLRRARGDRTKKDVADLLGVSYVYVGLMEKGARYPPPARLRQICRLFGETPAKWARTIAWERERDPLIRRVRARDVLARWYGASDTDPMPRPEDGSPADGPIAESADRHRVPVLSLAGCAQWGGEAGGASPGDASLCDLAERFVHGDPEGPRAFYVRAEGLSMTRAGIDPGDLVLVEPSRTDLLRGGRVVLAITDRGAALRRYYETGDVIVLQPDGVEGEPLTIEKTSGRPVRIHPVTEIRKALG